MPCAAYRPPRRRGAHPQNTIESVRAALDAGVDMIEFDVSPGLVVAHDPGHPGPRLDTFLDELAGLLP